MQVTFRTIKALQILRHKNNMLNRKRDTSNIPKAYVINLSLLQVQIRNLSYYNKIIPECVNFDVVLKDYEAEGGHTKLNFPTVRILEMKF